MFGVALVLLATLLVVLVLYGEYNQVEDAMEPQFVVAAPAMGLRTPNMVRPLRSRKPFTKNVPYAFLRNRIGVVNAMAVDGSEPTLEETSASLPPVDDQQLQQQQQQQLKPQQHHHQAKVVFKGLSNMDFAHPLDLEFQERVKRVPNLQDIVRTMLSLAEELIFVDNLANAVLVSEKMYPDVNKKLKEALKILDFPEDFKVDVYIKSNPQPNAYTLAVRGTRPFIVLHSSLVDLMSEEELLAVIAHELGHLKCEHGVLVNAANLLLLSVDTFGGPLRNILAGPLARDLLAWQQAAELTCDRAALLVTQDKDVVLSAMVKLLGGANVKPDQISTQAFLEQAEKYMEATQTPIGRLFTSQNEQTHPVTVLRAKAVSTWSETEQYTKLVESGVVATELK